MIRRIQVICNLKDHALDVLQKSRATLRTLPPLISVRLIPQIRATRPALNYVECKTGQVGIRQKKYFRGCGSVLFLGETGPQSIIREIIFGRNLWEQNDTI
jgi:hypothetical protein